VPGREVTAVGAPVATRLPGGEQHRILRAAPTFR
jgi:hypothetical protein